MEESVERLAMLFGELDRLRAQAQPEAIVPPSARLGSEPVGPAASPPVITQTIAASPGMFRLRREIDPLLGKLRNAMGLGRGMVLYVTSAAQGDGASTIARELAWAAGAISSMKTLLLDCHTGGNDQSSALGHELPSVIASYTASGHAEVAAVGNGEAVFHAATLAPGTGADGSGEPARTSADLYRLLRGSYDLIVLDCPPVLEMPYFPRMTQEPPEVLLVIQAERTRIPVAMRAKNEIAMAGAHLAGIIMNKRRFFIPKFIYRHL